MTTKRWKTGVILWILLLMASPAVGSAQDRGWEPLVSESQRGSYESSRYAPLVRVDDMLIASGVIGTSREGDNSPRAQFRRAFERVIEVRFTAALP